MVLRFSHTCAVCILGLSLAGHPRADEPVNTQSRITAREALVLAERHNPDLEASRLGLLGFDSRLEQASLRPAIELSAEMENIVGSGNLNGVDGAEITLALSQLIELGGKREHRVGVVSAQRDLVQSELERQRLELAAEVLIRFIKVAADQSRLDLAAHEQALAQRTLTTVGERVEAALAPDAEQHRARAALEKAMTGAEVAQLSHARSLAWLAALWDDSSTQFSGVVADLYKLPAVIEFEQLIDMLERSPLARSLLNTRLLRESELQLVQSQSKPDLSLSGGIRRLEASDDNALVFSLSVPLQTARRNSSAVRASRAGLDQATALGEAAMTTARSVLARHYQELVQVRTVFESLRDRVMPELEAALEGTETAYAAGRYGYLELIDAQSRLIGVQRDLIEAAAHYHELLAGIERLTGQALAQPASNEGEHS